MVYAMQYLAAMTDHNTYVIGIFSAKKEMQEIFRDREREKC